MKKIDGIYNSKMKDKGTITALFGLNKIIDKIEEVDKPPKLHKEV
jgi:hypothetical protein